MTPAIALEGVTFEYRAGTRALEDVSLAVAPGERVALIGQNGSGKSTLVRQLNGLLRPTRGRVLHDDIDTVTFPVSRMAATVGLLFQNPDLQIFAERVVDEVSFGPRNLGRASSDVDRAVRDALEATGLSGVRDANPFNLGYSRRKLVALASVLAMGTPIVVLDEPTTGQDAPGVARIQRVVEDLAAAGRTVIGISHDLGFVAESFDRVVVLRSGRIVADGHPAEIFDRSNWTVLGETNLEPPPAARVGAYLGLGSTPNDAVLRTAIEERVRQAQ